MADGATPKFKLEGERGNWHPNFIGKNGEIMLTGETHARKSDAKRSAEDAAKAMMQMFADAGKVVIEG